MDFSYSPIALLFILATVIQILLVVYIVSHPRTSLSDPSTRTLVYVLVAAIFWSGPYAMQLMTTKLPWKLLLFKFEHLGPMFVMPAFLLHVSTYLGYYSWFTPRRLALLGVEPAITSSLVLTNHWHNLLWSDPEIVSIGSTLVFHRTVGPWWYFRVAYQYLLVVIVLVLLVNAYRSTGGDIRRQIRALLLAFSIPLVVNAVFDLQYLLDLVALGALASLELTGGALGVTGVILSYSLVRYRYLDLGPIGRHVALEHLRDPYVVVDDSFDIVDFNAAFADISLEEVTLIGSPVTSVFPEIESLTKDDSESTETTQFTRETVHVTRAGNRWFDVQKTRIEPYANGGPTYGFVFLFRDSTESMRDQRMLKSQTEQLKTLNQLIRHDIRNDMMFLLSVLQRLQRDLPPERSDQVASIERTGDRIINLTESAQDIVDSIFELTEELEPIRISTAIEREVANAALVAEDGAVTIEGEIPDVDVMANELVSSVFGNLLENAIKHSENPDPRVAVEAAVHEGTITVDITDNGPGISDERKESIFEYGTKRVDSEGGGYGLYLVRHLVEHYGGEISVRDRSSTEQSSVRGGDTPEQSIPPEHGADAVTGSVFSVTLPLARSDRA